MPDAAHTTPRELDARGAAPAERPPDVEPTLGVVLRSIAARRPPRHVLEAVSVALPWAAFFASMGWWRASMCAAALGAFGLWTVGDRWARCTGGWRRVLALTVRGAAAAVWATLAAALVLDVFFRLMGAGPIS